MKLALLALFAVLWMGVAIDSIRRARGWRRRHRALATKFADARRQLDESARAVARQKSRAKRARRELRAKVTVPSSDPDGGLRAD